MSKYSYRNNIIFTPESVSKLVNVYANDNSHLLINVCSIFICNSLSIMLSMPNNKNEISVFWCKRFLIIKLLIINGAFKYILVCYLC